MNALFGIIPQVLIEIDSITFTLIIAGFCAFGLILGFLIGMRKEQKSAMKIPKDSGLIFIQALEEQKIPDTSKIEVSFIKNWIKKVYSEGV
jgi:hypothetical protein